MKKSTKIKTVFTLLIGVTLFAVILSACAPSFSQAEPENPVAGSPGEVQRVSPEESKAAFDSGEAIFLDVRSESSYAANHIPGALSIPLAEIQTRAGELDSDQWIITYCT
jgi:3-mercaptopyruvate sulfurtransferase SseA